MTQKQWFIRFLMILCLGGPITNAAWQEIAAQRPKAPVDFSAFAGTSRDDWFGDVTIERRNGSLRFDSKRSFLLTGDLYYHQGNSFIVKRDDRSLDADALVLFQLDEEGKAAEMTMRPISPLTDLSFDFQDIHFSKVETQ